MEEFNQRKNAKWWCIHFAQDANASGANAMDPLIAKKLKLFLKRFSDEVVFGKNRVFLNLEMIPENKKRCSLRYFQHTLLSIAPKLNLHFDSWQWGEGATMAEAWVHARWKTLSSEFLPIDAIADFMNPLALDRSSAKDNRRLAILRSYGFENLQDLIEMPEDELLSQCGVWVDEFCREHFSRPDELREVWLERDTAASLQQSNRAFQLDEWIPREYLDAG